MLKFSAAMAAVLLSLLLASCASAPTAPPPASQVAEVDSSAVPEPFWDFNPMSTFTIDYADVDAILGAMVIDTGRSKRERIAATKASTGTRLSTKVRRNTGNEGNRFLFEEFKKNPEYAEILSGVRTSLEAIPSQVPLENFTREEQLAYWLNLYNITMLDELVRIYPERNLEKELTGRNSIKSQKILNVAGIPLSLDDIQHTILRWNYDDNPIVIYGLYQGIIGGPNIRNEAYRGDKVYQQLQDNAEEFINSNRGTYSKGGKAFHVSSYYARNLAWFEDAASHLRQHLLTFIEGAQREQLRAAEYIAADIDDWSITDTYSKQERMSSSFSHNPAAMLGAVTSTQQGESPGTTITTSMTEAGLTHTAADPSFTRIKRRLSAEPARLEMKNRVSDSDSDGSSEPIPGQESPSTGQGDKPAAAEDDGGHLEEGGANS